MPRGPVVKYSEDVAARVERLAALGMTQEDAGYILGFSVDTLSRFYNDAWKKGKAKAKANIAGKLYEKAMAGDSASIFFYLKTQAGWREVQKIDMSSSDGTMSGPMDVRVKFVHAKKQEDAE